MYYSRFTKVPEIWNESNMDLENLKFMDERPYSTDYLKRIYKRLEDKEIEVFAKIEDSNNSATLKFQHRVSCNILDQMVSIENELARRIRYVKFIDALNNDNEGA